MVKKDLNSKPKKIQTKNNKNHKSITKLNTKPLPKDSFSKIK